ncbi:hypothetical protein [Granulicella arctica]|uniref:hypothetical protein n=1 Tax=Granulicella arctica TaxID=940613 RepID=UPI0021E054DF|nr:hypothetical protein [Granulicella arctica]
MPRPEQAGGPMEFIVRIFTRQNLILAALALVPSMAFAAQLSSDGRSAIPHDVQQLIVVDYRAMQNSSAAMSLKDRVLPPELKRLETALKNSGMKVDQDADVLAFAAFRVSDGAKADGGTRTVGIAQGQFQTRAILANFAKNKVKPVILRNNSIYPMASGSVVSFLNQTTMVFGDRDSVKAALDARDGMIPNFLTDTDMVNEMATVDTRAVWSLLDQKGTQTMMKGALGEAAQLADYDTIKNRFKSSRYTMDFQNGVRFEMAVVMSDTVTAATVATLMQGAALLKKSTGTPLEKTALDQTRIDSNAGTLSVNYSSSDSQFASLLSSPLFQSVVR